MIKIVAVCILMGVIIIYVKSINSEFALICLIVAGILILSQSFTYIQETFSFINNIASITGVDGEIFKIVLKTISIGYIVEFGAGILDDFGLKSLADKLVFLGKLIILSISIPIFYSIIKMLSDIL